MQIKDLIIERTAALAPMAGLGDTAFRRICKAFGAAYLVSEMASAKGIGYDAQKTRDLLAIEDTERPIALQLFGSDPDTMAEAAKKAMDYSPDVIDLNMGCPAPKIAGSGAGAALMRDPALAGRITRAVSSAVPVPVTVKFRKGWDAQSINAVAFARRMEDSGAAALTIHGRTREQFYAPEADWEIIAAVKQAVSIPVIGNGDCASARDIARMYHDTGCDLVMAGRGALGNPWIFKQARALLLHGELLPDPAPEERMQVMMRHLTLLCEYKGEGRGMREARHHAAYYLKGLKGAAGLRRMAGTLCTLADARAFAARVLETQTDGKGSRENDE